MSSIKEQLKDKDAGKKAPKIAPLGSIKHKHELCDPPNIDVPSKEGTSLKVVWGYAAKDPCQFVIGMISLVIGSLANFAVPGLVGVVVDAMTQDPTDWDSIKKYCTFMLVLVLISSGFVWIRAMTFNSMSERIACRLRYDIFYFLINKDVEFFDETKTGDILSRISSDTSVIQDGLSTNISMAIRSIITIGMNIAILAFLSWKLTILVVLSIIPVVLLAAINGWFQKKIQKQVQSEKAIMSSVSEEAISCIRTVKAFASEAFEGKRYQESNERVYQLGKTQAMVQAFVTFMWGLILNSANGAIIYCGAVLVLRGELTVGGVTSFLLYMIFLIFNFIIIGFVISAVYKVFGACEKIVEMMRIAVEAGDREGLKPDEIDGSIEIRNVCFSYPTKPEVQVSKNLNITIGKNKVVALVGHSGCGKSSVISLIEKYYNPSSGEIFFSGRNINEYDSKWYKNQIGIVSQEPNLFTGTIRENICYGLDMANVSEQDIDIACQKSNAYNFIHDPERFPDVYDTLVGERGVKLSGGQKQRVAIARALIRKPRILLLDEATSALDAESEHQVQKAIDILIKEGSQTVIVIAHRLSTIRDADTICVFEQGEIVERGTHNELIAMDGTYKTLIARQLQGNTSPSKLKETDTPMKKIEAPVEANEPEETNDIQNHHEVPKDPWD